MALRCLSFNHYDHLFAEAGAASTPEPFPEHRVVMFDPRLERGSTELSIGERWRLVDGAKRAADLIVVRGSSRDFAATVERDAVLRGLVGKVPLATLAGSWDASAREPQLGRPSWSSASLIDVPLDVIRTHELLTLIIESKSVYRERDCHFLLPSTTVHAEAFVRLADALDDHTDLVRIADWVLPMLENRVALLGDNGSLLGLLSVIRYEALRRYGWDAMTVATLDEYPDRAALRGVVDGLRAQDWERVLFLITVSSSGSIARRAKDVPNVDMDVVVLCDTNPPPATDGTCFAHYVIERWDAEDCEACPKLQVLTVDPRTYQVQTMLSRNKRSFDRDEAARCKPFWEAVDRTDAVKLHVRVPSADGNPAGPRHLAVSLDVPLLLEDPWFREQCVACLRAQPRPDLVLIPGHAATGALAELVCEAHELEPDDVVRVSVDAIDAALRQRMHECATVLVADDVVITAETMATLRRDIYAAGQPDHSIAVWGFAAVMRPPSRLEVSHIRRPFTAAPPPGAGPTAVPPSSVRLGYGFNLFLPPPGEKSCPWCAERALLEDRLDDLTGPARSLAEQRLTRLRRIDGLEPPLLLAGDDPESLTRDSYFGDLHAKAAFAAAAAVAQRQKDSLLRDREANVIELINVPLALEAFYDTILLAGLLRTFDRRDLRDTADDATTERALGEYRMDAGVLAEAGLAAVGGKLPPAAVRRRLVHCDALGEVAELLLALLDE